MVTVKSDCVKFSFFRPHASSVHLVGDFNGWKQDMLAMTPTGDGFWHAELDLPPGIYKFRYLSDGEWFTDYAAFGVECGPFGPDSVLRVA